MGIATRHTTSCKTTLKCSQTPPGLGCGNAIGQGRNAPRNTSGTATKKPDTPCDISKGGLQRGQLRKCFHVYVSLCAGPVVDKGSTPQRTQRTQPCVRARRQAWRMCSPSWRAMLRALVAAGPASPLAFTARCGALRRQRCSDVSAARHRRPQWPPPRWWRGIILPAGDDARTHLGTPTARVLRCACGGTPPKGGDGSAGGGRLALPRGGPLGVRRGVPQADL